jgi:opacity protein-like surface antigen
MPSFFRWSVLIASLALVLASAAPARAQAFVSPFVGYNFGGDAACPTVSDCDDKSMNFGVSFGSANALIGFEEEIGYARNFFKDADVSSSSVFTLMSNVIVGPRIKAVRPYGVAGIGLMKARVEFTRDSLLALDNNNLGWNVGGGVMLVFGHVGIRGDIRYFHGFSDLDVFGVRLGDIELDYGRAMAGLVLAY